MKSCPKSNKLPNQVTLFWFQIIHFERRWRVVDYFLIRTHGNVRLMDQLDVIGRTSELARLFGIQFNEVLTRGSQFRVESIMLRLVKARNYIPVSSSVQVSHLFHRRSPYFLLKMGQPRPLLSFIFGLFKQTSLQFLQQMCVKNGHYMVLGFEPMTFKHSLLP